MAANDEAPPADWARPVVHWEIEAQDPDLIRAFYAQLFSWNIGDGPIMNVGAGIGGPENGVGGHIRGSGTSRVNLYIQVRDLRTALDQAVALGGSVTLPPFDVPGGASLAGIKDPEGNPLMLVQQ